MSKNSKSSRSQPLAGIRVLVGRARHQAGALSTELRKLGADVIEIPFIEIRNPKSFKPLDAALKHLLTYDWLILTSVNGVDAMWQRIEKLKLDSSAAKAARTAAPMARLKSCPPENDFDAMNTPYLRVAAIGPATKKAIEQRGLKVDVVPKEYVAESVVRRLRRRVKGKRVLLVRAKIARDVIPRELRKAGAHVDVVEAYETVIPETSRRRLQALLKNPKKRPHVVTFTSSSTVRNFVELLRGSRASARMLSALRGRVAREHSDIHMASIGPVTSATLREFGLTVDLSAQEYTIPGLVEALVRWAAAQEESTT
jgi:uroporphyrinogen-III synthase